MRWQEKQAKIEADVYEAINELEDEIGVVAPYYPTVFWVGKTIEFEDTGLAERKQARFFKKVLARESCLMWPRIILIFKNDPEAIKEEAAHFIHLSVSGLKLSGHSIQETICARAIAEMLGIFGAKMLGSHRKNNFEIVPDLSRLNADDWQVICDALPDYFQTNSDFYEFYACQQGYGLGERIFYQYVLGNISQKFIKGLFLDPLIGPKAASQKFIRLKKRFWPESKSQATK